MHVSESGDTGCDPAAAIADEIVQTGTSQRLPHIFRTSGFQAPLLMWDPAPADLPHPLLRQFHALCREMRDDAGNVTFDRFDLDQLAPLMDWLLILDVEDGGRTLRYAHYGKVLANHRGRSMRGKTVSAFGGHISLFFESVYRAVFAANRWMLTTHEPPLEIFARAWWRLIVPVLDPVSGRVCRFAVLTVPENEVQPGLEIIPDPILIADKHLKVRFANASAREVFAQPFHRATGDISVADYTGIDLAPPLPPRALAAEGRVHDRVIVTVSGTLQQEFLVTLSGTVQYDRAFYLISFHPILPLAKARSAGAAR